ncbi:hypothetical protein SADUNF_Sadunf02G0133400 [Salix dunnii]|uniref:Uncharacterized protein n=1 Tax=Salix dunnii TaxID=1413687 RepID=A0A835TH23_9ROSI|nr:hypothetical protein SADUNF_Sadunf02G0133400 [Salix dunnii]
MKSNKIDTMDNEKGEGGGGGANDGTKKKLAEALRKCLEENKGDRSKCKSKIDALRSRKRRLLPPRLKSGSLTDV